VNDTIRPNAPLLEVSDMSKTRGGRHVLERVQLTVETGELVVLLGPNGAGKTTLLSAACGRIAPDSGTVKLAGADPRREARARRTLGFVPQEIALYPFLTVSENLQVFGRMMGVHRRRLEARIKEALDWSGLSDRRDERVDKLSGGMRRRLNIVTSLLHEPALLMLDEPTVGVDVNARERIHELLKRLRNRGLGILLTTHDLDQATTLADRVAFLMDGKIRMAGAPESLIARVFGTDKQLTVSLHKSPSEDQRQQLAEQGLFPGADGLIWSGGAGADYCNAIIWQESLQSMGLDIAEVRLREPGLEAVFLRLTGEELIL